MFDHPLGRGGNRILEAWVGAESRFLWPAALPPLLLPVLLPTTCTYCPLPCSALASFTAGEAPASSLPLWATCPPRCLRSSLPTPRTVI